jgi:hypothetical protein
VISLHRALPRGLFSRYRHDPTEDDCTDVRRRPRGYDLAGPLPGCRPERQHDLHSPQPFRENQSGEHYDTVVANYTRRCTSLDGQFTRLRATMATSTMLQQASALHDQGVAHCNGGARLQGIDELTAAIRQIGGIPRVEL